MYLKKNYTIFLSLLVIGCANHSSTKVKIVDGAGRPAKINKMTIQFNEEQMAKQKEAVDRTQNSTNRRIPVNKFKQQDLEDDTFITPDTEQNINDYYPDELFADRITNYNYQYNNKNVENTQKKQIQNVSSNVEQLNTVVEKKEKEKKVEKSEKIVEQQKGYYVQIGIYSEKKNAENIYKKYSVVGNGKIEEYSSKGKKYKVVLGPYKNREQADKDLNKVIKMGHYDVYVTEQK